MDFIWPKNSPELEKKRQEEFEKDREFARQEEAKRTRHQALTLELEEWQAVRAKFDAEQVLQEEKFRARALKAAAEAKLALAASYFIIGPTPENSRFATEEEMREFSAQQTAMDEAEKQKKAAKKEQEHREWQQRLDDAALRQRESAVKAELAEKEAKQKAKDDREEVRKRKAEDRERLRIRCRALGNKGFTKQFKRQQQLFRSRAKNQQRIARWHAQVASAEQWRAKCKDRYERLTAESKKIVDAKECERRYEAEHRARPGVRLHEENKHDGPVGYRVCSIAQWDNAVRAIEEG